MKYQEGLVIAQKYGLENEFNREYNSNTSAGDDEENAVYEALSEWDLLPILIPEASFNNCDELISWLEDPDIQEELCLKPVKDGVKKAVEFQGDIVQVEYYEPDLDEGAFYIRDNHIFFISKLEDDGRFEVQCIPNGCALTDYYLVLPKYVRDEFIATIEGKY